MRIVIGPTPRALTRAVPPTGPDIGTATQASLRFSDYYRTFALATAAGFGAGPTQ